MTQNANAAIVTAPAVKPTCINTATTTLVKSGPGAVSSVTCNKGQSGATMSVYDGLDATGTLMAGPIDLANTFEFVPPAPVAFSVGLCVVTSGLTTGSVTFYTK